ncbi:MAG: alpha-amylase family glycosyl hydrolase [Proteobacteria bacterium]|nr:alpha-amylase family glycosyl hydrolase [Pseudomonadota bacterium]
MSPAHIMEFHISRKARDLYRFDDALFSLSGNVVFANFHAARMFAQKINQKKDLVTFPEQAVKAGQINAMGLIDEVLHYVVALYREEIDPQITEKTLAWLYEKLGKATVDTMLYRFTDEFPPVSVYKNQADIEHYLESSTSNIPNRLIALEEMILLWLTNMNPAFLPFGELFDDTTLKKEMGYLKVISSLKDFFEKAPPFGPDSQNLIDMLRSPAVAIPYSLPGQIEYIREHWGFLLRKFQYRILGSLDLIKEEEKITFAGPGPMEVLRLIGIDLEAERFSPDLDWMPRLVLIAKNIYVWIDQLSKKYGQNITRLDQIPDEELYMLQKQGFTGLWLIGVWERSPSSQKIKQLCGNPEAVSSAYSLFDYTISNDLGGEEAYQALKDRAWKRGIRLASDMVPNHTGVFSKWTTEHPDWFISLNHNPFPWYSFNKYDLSPDRRIGIFIEDHYFNRTDAAVVFKRVDRETGEEAYVYHGNDGTSMPWNDTAQLNYLKPEVREAMIQTILHVARKFSIIRFDAAMTLTKKHYQRLWFPEPGKGGAIPTRAEYGLTKDVFNKLVPNEFWREVVDRIAVEAPDTLLMAEAFWLLEGYFVRTLGMHRVYNSAFMNILRDEDNAKYRTVMKNILEFDPEILKRLVNFMNNPDEKTAVEQFGKDKKYFGICTMMVTMPGLPMFGHGQVEGYTEKYGMEYSRAYWDEIPDTYLVQRHEREIFPLLHKRHLFAGVENFLLYDFFSDHGNVNEDVFAFSNRYNNERTIVVYNNKNSNTKGWIKTSVAYSAKKGPDGTRILSRETLGNGLNFNNGDNYFTIFKDHTTNLEYIRKNRELFDKGLFMELGPYDYHVFIDFYEIQDNERQHYASLASYLKGRGVPNIDEALHEVFLQPVHRSFGELVNAHTLRRYTEIYDDFSDKNIKKVPEAFINEIEGKTVDLLREITFFLNISGDELKIARDITHIAEVIPGLSHIKRNLTSSQDKKSKDIITYVQSYLKDNQGFLYTIFGWLFVHRLGCIVDNEPEQSALSRSWIDEWKLGLIITDTLMECGYDEQQSTWSLLTTKILTTHQSCLIKSKEGQILTLLESLFSDPEVQHFLQVNRYKEALWFNKESFEQLMGWIFIVSIITLFSDPSLSARDATNEVISHFKTVNQLLNISEQSNYQVEKLLEIAKTGEIHRGSVFSAPLQ